ncbi:MAG: hypothetical protein ACOYL3_19395 [Desulfuromonadaceae bacterium]
MEKIIKLFKAHKIEKAEEIYDKLIDCNLITTDATVRNVAVFMVACSIPPGANFLEYVVERLHAETEEGLTFAQAIRQLLAAPAPDVAKIEISQSRPFATISFMDEVVIEFEIQDDAFTPLSTNFVISGSFISRLYPHIRACQTTSQKGETK